MNERIKQFALEAKAQYCDLSDASCFKRLGLVEAVVFKPEDLEKFAELIVAEAIAVVQRRFMGDLNREDMEVRRCIEDVKKHFGVE